MDRIEQVNQELAEIPFNGKRPIFAVVRQVLQEERWLFHDDVQKTSVRFGLRGIHGTWICTVQVDEAERRLVLYVMMGMNISAQYQAAVLEYLNLANYRTLVGNFEMDADTGYVRFRSGMEAPEADITPAMVRRLVRAAAARMDEYFPGVLAIIHSGLKPVAALARTGVASTESALDW